MPYGTGSWGLPEFGLTEKLGGNKKSVQDAQDWRKATSQAQSVANSVKNVTSTPSASKSSAQYGPYLPSILGDKTSPAISTNKTSTTKKSSGGSSGGSTSQKTDAQREYEKQQSEVNSIYDDIMNYIGKQRDNLNKSKGGIMQLASNPYDAMKPRVEASANEAVDSLRGLATDASVKGENALDSARRLYGELGSRNQQVFGSGALSSAGQASSELLARDQARQFGDIRTQVSTEISGIENEIVKVQREKDVKLNEIESQKQQELTRAELNFRDELAKIDQMEYQTKQSKKVDKINLLRQYRQDVSDINKYTRELQSNVVADTAAVESELEAQYTQIINGHNQSVGDSEAGVDGIDTGINASEQEITYNNAMGYGGDPLSTATGAYGKKKSYEDMYANMG